jgi:hypothetical protein
MTMAHATYLQYERMDAARNANAGMLGLLAPVTNRTRRRQQMLATYVLVAEEANVVSNSNSRCCITFGCLATDPPHRLSTNSFEIDSKSLYGGYT